MYAGRYQTCILILSVLTNTYRSIGFLFRVLVMKISCFYRWMVTMILLKVQGMHTVNVFLNQQIFYEKCLLLDSPLFLQVHKVSNLKDILNSMLLIPLFLILKLC